VTDLMARDWAALQAGNFPEELKKQITGLGVEFRLMTQFTSFVAVEEMTITKGGIARKIAVPVEMPDGVSYEGVFGEQQGQKKLSEQMVLARGFAFGGQASGMSGRGGLIRSRDGATRGLAAAPSNNALSVQGASARPGPAGAAPATAVTQPTPAAGAVIVGGVTGATDPARKPAQLAEKLAREAKSEVAEGLAVDAEVQDERAVVPDPMAKLDASLRGLAEKVEKEGKNGSLTVGALAVTDFKVDVMIYLADASDKTREALKNLGFESGAESKAVRLVVGSIDVRRLVELAKLEAVVAVKPVGA
jgi:hypothetical protein